MEEDTEYRKLSIEDRCTHKLWKARVDGYEEAARIFREIDDEKSSEWNKFTPLIKKLVIDSNAMAQEKGLEAALVYVENCGNAGKTAGDVMSGIVQKCIAAPKTKTKDLAVQVTLMFIEIEKQDIVLEELLKGMEHKNPKIVVACTAAATLALKEFGNKVVNVKSLIKKLAPLMSDRDKAVRDEGKLLAIEIYRWIGIAMKAQISSLPSVTITELESEFEKVKGEKPEPSRYLKSQQEKQQTILKNREQEGNDFNDIEETEAEEIDSMDLIDPVDILSKLPKDFYEKLEAKKWQERKESLEILEKLLENPKLEVGDYGDLVKTLKRILTKDTNVLLVAMAGKCIALLAKGLGKRFSIYAMACSSGILEKFKEKKTNVVLALRDAIDAIYPATTLEALQEDIFEALASKNPSVKAETASFLARAFTKTQPTSINKKLLKSLVTALLKTLNESDPIVRDNSAEALGTLLKLIGEKVVGPYFVDVDTLKMAKIKECQERAVILVKTSGVKKDRPLTAPVKNTNVKSQKGGSLEPKPVTRPVSAAVKKTGIKKIASSSNVLPKNVSSNKMGNIEKEMTQEDILSRAEEIFPSDVLIGLSDTNLKIRMSSVGSFLDTINELQLKPGLSQVLIRTIVSRKPGLKDTNFQIVKTKLEIIKLAVEKFGITSTTADFILTDITEKLADPKNSNEASQVLFVIAEGTKLEYVIPKISGFAFEQKSPKIQIETLKWINCAIKEFGLQVNLKLLIEDIRKSLQSINPCIRSAGISLLGTMYLYMGKTLLSLFDNEKLAIKQQIQAEFDKNSGIKPPIPFRGIQKSASSSSINDDDEIVEDEIQENTTDHLPRIDISPQITEALLSEISDKNWKTRNEGLIKLQGILNDAKLIKSTIGDLPQVLASRLIDSNAKIAQIAVSICEQLASLMGPSCKIHVRTLFPGFLHGLGDNKAFIRSGCLSCINAWGEQCGYKEFFDGEMIADALKVGSPSLKTELWGWLAEKLPIIPIKMISKDELNSLLPHLYANISDRNVDVRKNANEAVLGVMIHLGYEAMVKALDKQKPTSKKDIQAALDKARPNLPVKPLPKSKQQAPIAEETKSAKSNGGKSSRSQQAVSKSSDKTSTRKKDEDIDTSPLLMVNNSKNQRLIDEQKLRVLKWSFTTPREEFTELLKEQMLNANVNKALMANMFHEDFRYHLKAIELLADDLPNNEHALICNLDLIIKWISLRFYDTNPSVLLKGLDYLNMVFQMLVERDYMLAENEGTSFIPHLLIKIGDPKDTVRNGVRKLLRQILHVYPYTKVFTNLMDGLKSKNARQRTECLDELAYLIEQYTLAACQPTPQAALKEIARHISDRDNSVRNSALKCIVQAYHLSGDKVYKLIGQLSEKELSMLDERIKRSQKPKKFVPTIEPVKVVVTESVEPEENVDEIEQIEEPVSSSIKSPSKVDDEREKKEEKLKRRKSYNINENSPGSMVLEQPQLVRQKLSGPFGLDPEVIAEIEKDWVKSDQLPQAEIIKVDLQFMNSPIKIALIDGVGYPAEKFQRLITNQSAVPSSLNATNAFTYTANPSQPLSSRKMVGSCDSTQNLPEISPKLDQDLIRILRAIGSTDSLMARAAMNDISEIIDSQEKQAVLKDYEEIFVQSILAQFKNLARVPINESMIIYQPLLSILYAFFDSRSLGKNLGIPCIKDIMSVLLGLMAEQKLAPVDNGEYTKVINAICLRILNKTSFTNLNCALIRLLKETCPSAGLPKFTDLLMKCIWRNVKVIPERSNELDYDAILYEVHEFMLVLPSAWWQQRPNDTPLRTVKTIVHNMAKIKGNAILNNLNRIPTHSELYACVLRILKNLQINAEPIQKLDVNKEQPKRLSNHYHESMSQILRLIAEKETTKQGLLKLYEFKKENPEIDIQSFLPGASSKFQKYIEEGLADIDKQRLKENSVDRNNSTISRSGNKQDADYWMEKLHHLKIRGNLDIPRGQENHNMMDNKAVDENLILNQIQKVSLIRKDKTELSPNRLEHLQQKLAQIKQQKHT